jgi:hypothetical protein
LAIPCDAGSAVAQTPKPGDPVNVIIRPRVTGLMLAMLQNGPTKIVAGNIYGRIAGRQSAQSIYRARRFSTECHVGGVRDDAITLIPRKIATFKAIAQKTVLHGRSMIAL